MTSNNVIKAVMRVLLPVLVVALALGIANRFIKSRPKPRRQEVREAVALVETLVARRTNVVLQVSGMGTVAAMQEVSVQPQVSGLVVWKNPNLEAGAVLAKGEEMLHIEETDYLAVKQQQQAALERARVDLELERSRAAVAAQEWEMLGEPSVADEAARALALRTPQLRAAQAALTAAVSAAEKAERDVQRTRISAPFNCVVLDEAVDVGQLATPQTRAASIAGADACDVTVALPVRELALFPWPDAAGNGGAAARVIYEDGNGGGGSWTGRVVRVLRNLDPAARLARVTVRIENPFDPSGPVPLLLGAYVRADIEGRSMDDVFALPDNVVHEGAVVWVMTGEQRLAVREVHVLRRRGNLVLVRQGLEDGDVVITSRLPSPIPGMKLKNSAEGGDTPTGPDEE